MAQNTRWHIRSQNADTQAREELYKDQGLMAAAQDLSRCQSGAYPILVCGNFALGDSLIIEPSLRALRRKFPLCKLHMACNPAAELMLRYHPDIEAFILAPFSSRLQLMDLYLHHYDLRGWMTRDSNALRMNSYDAAAARLGVRSHDAHPRYFFSKEEEDHLLDALLRKGLGPGGQDYLLLHPESSVPMRSWPVRNALDLVEQLGRTFRIPVIMVGKRLDRDLSGWDPPNGVFLTQRDFGQLTTRETLLLAAHTRLLVAVDSVFSHLGLAFDKPAVLLYGAFPPEMLAAAHYRQVHAPYHPPPCGPCCNHGNWCLAAPMAPISPCMQGISVEEVLDAVTCALEGRYPVPELKGEACSPVVPPSQCPVCAHSQYETFARRGSRFYLTCDACGSVYLETHDKRTVELAQAPSLHCCTDFAPVPEDLCAQLWLTIEQLAFPGLKRTAEMWRAGNSLGFFKCARKSGWQFRLAADVNAFQQNTARLGDHVWSDCRPAVVLTGDAVLKTPKPAGFWSHLGQVVPPHGLAVILAPIADLCRRKEAVPLIWAQSPQYLVIPSLKGLERMAGAAGFRKEFVANTCLGGWALVVWRKL